MWQVCVAGALARLALFSVGLSSTLGDHIDLTTPITSYTRLKEGMFLTSIGARQDAGHFCLQAPLVFHLLKPFLTLFDDSNGMSNSVENVDAVAKSYGFEHVPFLCFLVLVDMVIAVLLYKTAQKAMVCSESKVLVGPAAVASIYLFSPFSITGCVALSYQNLHLLVLASLLYCSACKKAGAAAVLLAIATYVMPIGPVFFIFPCAWITFLSDDSQNESSNTKTTFFPKHWLPHLLKFVVVYVLACAVLLYASYVIDGNSWKFLQTSFGYVLSLEDLTPTVGPFWYTFTLIFNRFKLLFLVIFHSSPFFYTFPLFVLLGRHLPQGPLSYLCAMTAIYCIFRPYPSASDFAFAVAVLLIHSDFVAESHQKFVISVCVSCIGLVVQPVMYFLWIGRNTGNANFLYFAFLTFHVASGVMISEWLSGGLKLRKRVAANKFCDSLVKDIFVEAIGTKSEQSFGRSVSTKTS